MFALFILCFLPWIPVYFDHKSAQQQKQLVDAAILEHESVANQLHVMADEITKANEELRVSTARNHNSYKQLKNLHIALDLESEKYLAAERMEEVLLERIDRIERLIQKYDREDLESR